MTASPRTLADNPSVGAGPAPVTTGARSQRGEGSRPADGPRLQAVAVGEEGNIVVGTWANPDREPTVAHDVMSRRPGSCPSRAHIPQPLSDDWLSWDPETIHRYPEPCAPMDCSPANPAVDPARCNPGPASGPPNVAAALMRDVIAGVVSGVVAALVLAVVIAFFPDSSQAAALETQTNRLATASALQANTVAPLRPDT